MSKTGLGKTTKGMPLMNEEMLNTELALLKMYGHSGITAEQRILIFSIDTRVPR
jgi:hypothetical protein